LFRTKTDNKSISMKHQKSDADETANSKHGTKHDNATPRKKKESSLSLSLSLFAKGSPLSVWPQQRGATTRRAHKKQNNIKRRRRVSPNEIFVFCRQ
jgi:hypothetical protein